MAPAWALSRFVRAELELSLPGAVVQLGLLRGPASICARRRDTRCATDRPGDVDSNVAAEKAAAAEEAAEKAKEELARRKIEAKEAKKRNQQREEAKKLKKQQEEEEAAAAAATEGDALLQKAKNLVATVEKAGLGGADDAGEEPPEADTVDVEGGASEAENPQEGGGTSGAEE